MKAEPNADSYKECDRCHYGWHAKTKGRRRRERKQRSGR